MKLYHVSEIDLNKLNGNYVMTPGIPVHRIEGEEGFTERICFSDSISGGLTASTLMIDPEVSDDPPVFMVIELDTDKYGIKPESIVDPMRLYFEGRVPDAYFTNEYWILEKVEILEEDIHIMIMSDYEIRSQDDFYPDIIENARLEGLLPEEYIEKYDLDYNDLVCGCFTVNITQQTPQDMINPKWHYQIYQTLEDWDDKWETGFIGKVKEIIESETYEILQRKFKDLFKQTKIKEG